MYLEEEDSSRIEEVGDNGLGYDSDRDMDLEDRLADPYLEL